MNDTAPILYSCWFHVPDKGAHPGEWYTRHARVLEHTARVNTPGWDVRVTRIGPPPPRRAARGGGSAVSYVYNTHKLEDWLRATEACQDGDRLLLIDSDTMILKPLDPVWEQDFDVAYTEKRGRTRLPLNGGVVFVRVSPRSRDFMRAWFRWNLKLLSDGPLHRRYWQTYAGMNQAALGALLENEGPSLATVGTLRCEEWNCESAMWATFDPENPPRIVHVKGALRRGLMGTRDKTALLTDQRRQIADVWWEYERAALAIEAGRRSS